MLSHRVGDAHVINGVMHRIRGLNEPWDFIAVTIDLLLYEIQVHVTVA